MANALAQLNLTGPTLLQTPTGISYIDQYGLRILQSDAEVNRLSAAGIPVVYVTQAQFENAQNLANPVQTPTPPPAPPTPPASTTPPTGYTPTQLSAQAIINQTLSQFGLPTLTSWAWQRYLSGAPIEQIVFELRDRPEYQARFPGMTALRQAGHAMTEQEYIGWEQAATGLMRQYGLPAGFYDTPDDFGALIGGQVSIAEFSQRLASYNDLANAQDPAVLSELQRLYGLSAGDLTAYFIDPGRALPLLQRQANATLTSAIATNTGFGGLTQAEAERYSGLSAGQAQQGFGELASLGEIFTSLPGENVAPISRQTQLGAEFDANAAARTEIQTRARRRTAEFEQGGQLVASRAGVTGLGGSSRT